MAPSPPGLPSTPGVVTVNDEERQNGLLSRANLQRALELYHRDGLLVLDGIINKADLDKLRESMIQTSDEIKSHKTSPTQFNHGIMSNFLQAPPLAESALLFPSVYQNPFVIQVMEGYLGSGLKMPFITANTAVANTTQKQPIHKDCSFVHPCAPFMGIANFLLSDFLPENGSTEFWLGSHTTTSSAEQMWRNPTSIVPTCDIIPDLLEERRATRPPSQVTVPFGSVLLRDVRTWHAGMPNPSSEDRIMVAVAYQAPWFPTDRRFKAPEASRSILTSNAKVEPLCDFYPDQEWLKFSQKWGIGEEMELAYSPIPGPNWWTIETLTPGQKYINQEFNPHAKG